jgi:hypothetical protein
MATITRTEAIEQIQEVLKAYENKIRDIRLDTEKLSPEGKNIVDSYCSNEENEQVLVKKAYSKKKFFKKVNETQLLEFYKVCYELNKNLSLDVKELLLITAIEEDKESFWESFWGALQGEFNEDPSGLSIMLDMGLNFIPFVGQALDARDILACLDKLIRQKRTHEIMIWVTLVLTAIGCVPYAGDVIKAIGKAILKGADDIIITLLKKLDAEDVYKAFIKFYNKINESTEEAIKIINQWLLEAEKRYNETDLSEVIRNANEYINKAIEFIQTKIDEFAQKMFGKGNITLDVKLLEETSSNSKKTIKFVNGQITGEITNALKTEPGTAFFWSGCAKVDPSSGKLLVSGDEVAAEIANKCGGTTLETQIKVNNIEMPKWDFDVPESIKAWEYTSAAYAKQVSGDVRAIVGPKLRPENIWENIELPRLMQNPNVSKITTIDPDTLAETVIFERKAGGKVFVKPNETLIKNGEWDKVLDTLSKNPDVINIEEIDTGLEIYNKNWHNPNVRVLTVSERINKYDSVKNIVTSGGGGGTSSQILRENLKNAGIEPPPYPNAAHHIVAVNSEKSRASVAILHEYGIDLNSPANGVFLPYQKNEFVTTEVMHCGGHLDSYHINVRKRLEDLIDKAEDLGYSNILIQKLICNEFQTIRKELLSGFLKIHN